MKREDVEQSIYLHCSKIIDIVKEYDPNSEYVMITLNPKTDTIIAYNRYWANDMAKSIDLMAISGKVMRGCVQQRSK